MNIEDDNAGIAEELLSLLPEVLAGHWSGDQRSDPLGIACATLKRTFAELHTISQASDPVDLDHHLISIANRADLVAGICKRMREAGLDVPKGAFYRLPDKEEIVAAAPMSDQDMWDEALGDIDTRDKDQVLARVAELRRQLADACGQQIAELERLRLLCNEPGPDLLGDLERIRSATYGGAGFGPKPGESPFMIGCRLKKLMVVVHWHDEAARAQASEGGAR